LRSLMVRKCHKFPVCRLLALQNMSKWIRSHVLEKEFRTLRGEIVVGIAVTFSFVVD
jgi:hypothetical protein